MNVTRWLMGRIWLLSGTQIRSFTRSSWWITHAAQSVCCINGKCITWKCVTEEGNMMRYKQSTLSSLGIAIFVDLFYFGTVTKWWLQIQWQHWWMWYKFWMYLSILRILETKLKGLIYVHYFIWFTLASSTCMFLTVRQGKQINLHTNLYC